MEGRRVYKIGHQGGTMVTQLWFITGLSYGWCLVTASNKMSWDLHTTVFTNVRQVPPLILGFLLVLKSSSTK